MVNRAAQQPQQPAGGSFPGGQQFANDFANLNLNPHRSPLLRPQDRQSPPLPDHLRSPHAYPNPNLVALPNYSGWLFTKSKVPGVEASWARVEKQKWPLTQEEFSALLNEQKKKGISVGKVYAHSDMKGYKRKQIDKLINDLTLRDPGYEYQLVLLKRQEERRQSGRATVSMKIILKRQYASDPQARVEPLKTEVVDIAGHHGYNPFAHQVHQSPPPPPPPPFAAQEPFEPHHMRPASPTGMPGVNHPQHHPNAAAGSPFPNPDRLANPMDQSRPHQNHNMNQANHNSPFPEPFFDGPGPIWDVPEQNHGPHHGPHHRKSNPAFDQPTHDFDEPNDYDPYPYHDTPPREHTKSNKKNPDTAKAGSGNSKNNPGRKQKKDRPVSDSFESDTSGFVSDASGFSRAGTNRTKDTEISDRDGHYHRKDKGHHGDRKDGHRSREREHESRDRGNHGLHGKDSRRSSRSSRDFEIDPQRTTYRMHRRKPPLRSGNSSPSSGSRYTTDDFVFLPSSSGRERDHSYRNSSRRNSGYSQDDRPGFHSRNASYDDPIRGSSNIPHGHHSRRRISYPIEIYDERAERAELIKENLKAEVLQELDRKKIENLERENERLKDNQYRAEPSYINNDPYRPEPSYMKPERERFGSGPIFPPLPRSRRYSSDIQSNRYGYGP